MLTPQIFEQTRRYLPGCSVSCSQPKISYTRSCSPLVEWSVNDEMSAVLGTTSVHWYAIDSALVVSAKWSSMTPSLFDERCFNIRPGRLVVFKSFYKWLGANTSGTITPQITYGLQGDVAVTFDCPIQTRDSLQEALVIIAAVHSAA